MCPPRPMYDCSTMESFHPAFSQAAVDDLRARLQQTRWSETAVGEGTSSLGVDRDFLIDLCRYWIDTFDWKLQLEHLAIFRHYRYQAKEGRIHFIHEKGMGPIAHPAHSYPWLARIISRDARYPVSSHKSCG